MSSKRGRVGVLVVDVESTGPNYMMTSEENSRYGATINKARDSIFAFGVVVADMDSGDVHECKRYTQLLDPDRHFVNKSHSAENDTVGTRYLALQGNNNGSLNACPYPSDSEEAQWYRLWTAHGYDKKTLNKFWLANKRNFDALKTLQDPYNRDQVVCTCARELAFSFNNVLRLMETKFDHWSIMTDTPGYDPSALNALLMSSGYDSVVMLRYPRADGSKFHCDSVGCLDSWMRAHYGYMPGEPIKKSSTYSVAEDAFYACAGKWQDGASVIADAEHPTEAEKLFTEVFSDVALDESAKVAHLPDFDALIMFKKFVFMRKYSQ